MKYLLLVCAAFASLTQAGFGDDLKKAEDWIKDEAKKVNEDEIEEKAEDVVDIWDKYIKEEKAIEESKMSDEEKDKLEVTILNELMDEIDKEWGKWLENQTEEEAQKDPLGVDWLDGLDEAWEMEGETGEVDAIKKTDCQYIGGFLED